MHRRCVTRGGAHNTRRFVFGGLAIMTTCVVLDPLALRPRLSPSLPLSLQLWNVQIINEKKRTWVRQVRQRGNVYIYFGGLAIITTCVVLDPLALRPRLSPSLPLSTI